MTKEKIVQDIADKFEISKSTADEIFSFVFQDIENILEKEQKFAIPQFGIFTVKQRAERAGINPKTGEKITIPARKVVTYKPSKNQKEKFA